MKTISSLFFSVLLLTGVCTAQTGKDAALETLGASAGLMLYNTYLVIGSMSDAYVGEVYDAPFVTEITQEQLGSIDLMITQYSTLLKTDFVTDASDRAFVSDIVVTLGYLKNEATYLKAYVETGSAEDSEKYEYNRNESWKKISKLLGFETE